MLGVGRRASSPAEVGSNWEAVRRTVLAMAEPTDEELDAEVASILRRPLDDPERVALESYVEDCEAMLLYAKHFVPEDGMSMECEPRVCRGCGESFIPPRNVVGSLCCSTACSRKAARRGALEALKLDRQRDAAARESQPT